MRLHPADIYIVSLAVTSPGTIIAARAAGGMSAVGKKIEKQIKLSKEEADFFYFECASNTRMACTFCGSEEKKAVIFFPRFSPKGAICIVVVAHCPAEVAATLVCDREHVKIIKSREVQRIAERGYEMNAENNVAFCNLRDLLQAIMRTGSVSYGEDGVSGAIKRMAIGVADIVGVRIGCAYDLGCEMEKDPSLGFEIFDNRLYAAVLYIVCTVARAYSTDRLINIDIHRGYEGYVIDVLIDLECDGELYELNYIKRLTTSGYGQVLSIIKEGRQVKCSFYPFYVDVGFLGVKGDNLVYKDLCEDENDEEDEY